MATMIKLIAQKDEFVNQTYELRNEAEVAREREFQATVRVQAWFRGQRTRAYIKYLNECATEIQRRWRAFLGRRHFREVVKQQVFIMKLNHYNAMATKIQKTWRGFFTRKYIFNYYSRKRYLEGLKIKNELIRSELEDYAEQQEMMTQIKREKMQKQRLDEFTKKNHFLVSTEVIPGVYNNPYKPYPEEIEFHLRGAKKLLVEEQKKKAKAKSEENIFDPGCTRYDLPRLKEPLPPLAERPQGPFREPSDVQKQRYKPFQPSLRVSTNFYSLDEARQLMRQEEWINRINDDIFLPASKRPVHYEKLLHTTSKYGHLEYGTKYFRQEFPDQWLLQNKDFQSVVPPIPIFEKLNDTYSQGQV
ncbi:hypothetical protein LSH36_154g12007 [Paralvinella palmiformis]|uniref:Spermatogenesis-associated protein 17 n=1 Tax=Paralvinella palmiformis TaxID=53620 RepID=A0AAD9N8K1_9ANNE|nr:hypothetical protein LSH36_154g12007 [Paralvinella palmiformis]